MVLIGCTVDFNGAKAIKGLEGKNLLSALTAFVKVVVDPPQDGCREQGEALNWLNMC